MSHDVWKTVAEIEGKKIQWHLVALMWSGCIGGAVILILMAYFDVAQKWLTVFAYAQGVLSIGAILNAIGARIEEGRSYMEQRTWAIHEKLLEISSH